MNRREREREKGDGNKRTWAEVNRFNRLTEDRHVAKEPNRFLKLQGNLGSEAGGHVRRVTGHRFAVVARQTHRDREHGLGSSERMRPV